MSTAPRRVVTGHDKDGKSVVVSDSRAPSSHAVAGGTTFHEIWATSGAPAPITAQESEPTETGASVPPPEQGTRIRIVEVPPGGSSPMHRTETVDYGIVLTGTMQMALDDGSVTTLNVGDIAVQRGTNHQWINASDELSAMAFVLLDAKFSDELLDSLPADVSEHLMDKA